jgi:hypothetical protein
MLASLSGQMKRINHQLDTQKQAFYFNYAKFRLVFKTSNPVLWLLPFEMEQFYVDKSRLKLDQDYDYYCYEKA